MLDILFISNEETEIPVETDTGLGHEKNSRYKIDTGDIHFDGMVYRATLYSEFGTGKQELQRLQMRYREYIKEKM